MTATVLPTSCGMGVMDPRQTGPTRIAELCAINSTATRSLRTWDYLLFVILNADHQMQGVALPKTRGALRWHRVIDTSLAAGADFANPGEEILLDPAEYYLANARSTVILKAMPARR